MDWLHLHGAATHFPVGLIMAAAFFELGAIAFLKPEWRVAAFWMVAFGVVMTLPSLVSGLMTARGEYGVAAWPLIVKQHITFAATASILGLISLIWRIRSRESRGAVALIVLAALAVAGAGYLGGEMALG